MQLLPPEQEAEGMVPLHRRGVLFGWIDQPDTAPTPSEQIAGRWEACEPVVLRGALRDGLTRFDAQINASCELLERLRDNPSRFLDELDCRLGNDEDLRYAGSTIDRHDDREIERVFVDAWARDEHRRVARDLYARLAWIADDETDASLRIRFSSGKETNRPLPQIRRRELDWTDTFFERTFPECEVLLGAGPVRELLDRLADRRTRLSERIVYSNAPGGGAVFHHDAEPGQLGVAFGQLAGRTAWFALAKDRLADLLVAHGAQADLGTALAALDLGTRPHEDADRPVGAPDHDLWQVLNRDWQFAGRLAAAGALHILTAGDVILLPSVDADHTCWHSVVALDDAPSLAHSYAVLPEEWPDRPSTRKETS